MITKAETLYIKARELEEILNANSRRGLARSDPYHGRDLSKPRDDILNQIYMLEIQIIVERELAEIRRENLRIDLELSAALADANKFMLYSKMGDYAAILANELQIHPAFHEFEFKRFNYVTELIAAVDSELMAKDKSSGEKRQPDTKILQSLEAAAEYLKTEYRNVNELVEILRFYAKRNSTFHNGAKKLYEEGDLFGLAHTMVKDRFSLDSYAFDLEQRQTFLNCLSIVQKHFFRQFSWIEGGKFTLSFRGKNLEKSTGTDMEVDINGISVPVKKTPAEIRHQNRSRSGQQKSLKIMEEMKEVFDLEADFQEGMSLVEGWKEGLPDSFQSEVETVSDVLKLLHTQCNRLTKTVEVQKVELDLCKQKYDMQGKRLDKAKNDSKDEIDKREDSEEIEGLGALNL